MEKRELLFLSFILLLSYSYSTQAGEMDRKQDSASSELQISCGKCSSYVCTTTTGSVTPSGLLKWESILKPASLVIGKDVSQLIPVSALPEIRCGSCKETCLEPVWHKQGESLKAMYRIMAGVKSRK